MATGIIDLDLSPPDAGRAAPRRFAPSRIVLVAAVLLLALGGLGAAAAPRPGAELLPVGAGPVAAYRLTPDTIFTASFGDGPGRESVVRRVGLPGAAERWATGIAQSVQLLVDDRSAHTLLAVSESGSGISMLDADTGALLWRADSPGTTMYATTPGGVLLAVDGAGRRQRLLLLDARTGRQRWSRAVDWAGYVGTDDVNGQSTRLAAVDRAGHAVVLNLADGAVLAEADLHLTIEERPTGGWDYLSLSTTADALVVARRVRGRSTLSSWSLDTLAPRWRATGGPVGTVYDCPPVACVTEDDTVTAVDPADGRVLWHRPELSYATRFDDRSLIAYDHGEPTRSELLDPWTGAVRQRLGVALGLDDLLLQSDTVRPGRVWVRTPAAGGRPTVRGALDRVAGQDCRRGGSYLVCPTTAGLISVWRLDLR